MAKRIILLDSQSKKEQAKKELELLPLGSIVELRDPKRSDLQNRRFHASIRDVSEQVGWAGEMLSEEDWKRLFIASLYGQKVVPGISGGFIVLAKQSSEMSVSELSELQEFIYAFGAERNVEWSEP